MILSLKNSEAELILSCFYEYLEGFPDILSKYHKELLKSVLNILYKIKKMDGLKRENIDYLSEIIQDAEEMINE